MTNSMGGSNGHKPYHVIVIGAGSTGSATAHDLALRGLKVTVIERGEIASGTTGRNHCLLHSGGRYAVTDHEGAVECIEENLILRRIMPDMLELNDGLFVATNESDLAFKPVFLEGCAACGIPARDIPIDQALKIEPYLNPKILAAVQIPDGVFEPYRFCLEFLGHCEKEWRRSSAVSRSCRIEDVGQRRDGHQSARSSHVANARHRR